MFQNNLLMAAASISAGGITVDDSVRYNDDDSPRLYRTPTTLGNRMTGSISLWYKRCNLGSIQQLFNAGAGDDITFNASDQLTFIDSSGVSYITTQVFRDPTAWGNLLFAWDTTLAAAGDRLRIYHNGTEITAFATETNPSQYDEFEISNVVRQTVGANESDTEEFDGYFSQFYYVDGQQLTPTDFGETDDNGVWRPIEFAGGGSGITGTVVPIMTSNTAPTGVASGGTIAGYDYWNAFDNNSGSNPNLTLDGFPTTLVYDFGSGVTKTITQYTLYPWPGGGDLDRQLKDWVLQASTDNFSSSIIDLDTVTGETGWTLDERRLFSFTNTTAYRYYRLYVTDVDGNARYSNYNEWLMMEVSSGYGTNGFFLDFADSSDFGNDVSGLSNDYTSSGLATNDQVTDTPTTNFCVLSPIDKSSSVTFSNGNLVATFGTPWFNGRATFGVPTSGKWSFQIQKSAANMYVGLVAEGQTDGDLDANGQDALYYYDQPGQIKTKRSGSEVIEVTNDPPGIADDTNFEVLIDKDNDQFGLVIGGTAYMAVDSGLEIQDTMTKIFVQGYSTILTLDFGQGGYSPSQTGYKALSTANLATPTIKDGTANFQPTLYTGDGSVRNIDQTENSTFQPDWVWIKSTASAQSNMLFDAPRGVTKVMNSNDDSVETTDANSLTSFDSDGFGLGSGAGGYNDNTESFVAWQWLAGGGAGSSNTAGTINTTTTTVNTTAGISIGTYTGTGSAATIGHGLGVAPQMVIVKERANDVGDWYIYHEKMAVTTPEDYYLLLNHYDPYGPVDDATIWNDTAPTSTVFSIGTADDVNGSTDTYVYYAFADVEGFSLMGSYIGNASTNGPFVYTGFKPSFILLRGVGRRDIFIYDSQRSPYNVMDKGAMVNEAVADSTSYAMDFLSNGFKIRSSGGFNASGEINIFAAFAEYPFGGDGVTPATAF